MPLTPEEIAELRSMGLNPDEYEQAEAPLLETTLNTEPATPQPVGLTESDRQELMAQGLNPDEYEPVQQPQTLNAGSQLPGGEAQVSPAVDYMAAFQRGMQSTVAPTTMTDQQMKETADNTIGEIVAEMAGAIGIDVVAAAASTKVGAMAGSVFGPLGTAAGAAAGLLGYSVYSAFGQEKLAEKRGSEFSTGRMAARTALAINPILRAGGTLNKAFAKIAPQSDKLFKFGEKIGSRVVRVAGQAAGEAAVAGSEMGKEAAMAAGGLSLALHSLGFRKRLPTPSESAAIGQVAASPQGLKVAAKIGQRVQEAADDINTSQYTDDVMTPEFARFVLQDTKVRNPVDRAKRYMAQVTNQDEIYKDFKVMKIAEEVLDEAREEQWSRFRRGGKFVDDVDPLAKARTAYRDGQNVALAMDQATGLGVTRRLNDLSEARGRFENKKYVLSSLAEQAYKVQKRAKISDDQMGRLRIYASGEAGSKQFREGIEHLLDDSGQLNERAKKVMSAWDVAWSAAADSVEAENFQFDRMTVYFPRTFKSKFEMAYELERFSRYANTLASKVPGGEDLAQWSVRRLRSAGLSAVEAKEFRQQTNAVKQLMKRQGRTGKRLTLTDLEGLRKSIIKENDRLRSPAEVTSVLQRGKMPIPANMRETNNRQAFMNYLNGNVKSAIMADSMREMSGIQQSLARNGFKDSSAWLETLLNDISGGSRKSARQWISDKENIIKYRVFKGLRDNADQWEKRVGWDIANVAAQGFSAWQASIYPAFLSVNIPALVRNLSQNMAKTAPELGTEYGYRAVSKAFFKNPWKYYDRMKKAGLLAKGVKAEAITPEDSRLLAAWSNFGDKAMGLYTKTDDINRMWSYAVGHEMARDLGSGSKSAIEALQKMGPGIQVDLARRGLTSQVAFRQNLDELGDALGKFLIGRTQYHYGPEQKAQFLRSVGPLFSMFTKWPVATISDIGTILDESPKLKDAAYRYFEKYGAIWMAALAVEGVVKEKNDPVLNYMVGNASSWAPAESAVGFSLLNNPRVESTLAAPGFIRQMVTADNKERVLKNIAKEALKSGAGPASGVLNELDRWQKAKGQKGVSDRWVESLFD